MEKILLISMLLMGCVEQEIINSECKKELSEYTNSYGNPQSIIKFTSNTTKTITLNYQQYNAVFDVNNNCSLQITDPNFQDCTLNQSETCLNWSSFSLP